MDHRRFDQLVMRFAGKQSRRSVAKTLLGIGSSAAVSAFARQGSTEAARRGEPTPTPAVTCPGLQIPCGDDCCCPNATDTKCGPDCCPAGAAECCDNACCYGACIGEELCCPIEQVCQGGNNADTCCGPGEECCSPGTDAHYCLGNGACCPGKLRCNDGTCRDCCDGIPSAHCVAAHGGDLDCWECQSGTCTVPGAKPCNTPGLFCSYTSGLGSCVACMALEDVCNSEAQCCDGLGCDFAFGDWGHCLPA